MSMGATENDVRRQDIQSLVTRWNALPDRQACLELYEQLQDQLFSLVEGLGGYIVPSTPPEALRSGWDDFEWHCLFQTGRSFIVIMHETGAELHLQAMPLVIDDVRLKLTPEELSDAIADWLLKNRRVPSVYGLSWRLFSGKVSKTAKYIEVEVTTEAPARKQ
jgi:hypothetical protein